LANPALGGFLAGEDLEVVYVADPFAGVDVNPHRHLNDSLTRSKA
jgi:hypothetical protein